MQLQAQTKKSFEYRSSDNIHTISMCMVCVLFIALTVWAERDSLAALQVLVLMGVSVLVIAVPILMRSRQDVVAVDADARICRATNRRLLLADKVMTFGSDDVDVIGALEFHGDGGPFYKPVVRTKSGHQFVFGPDAVSAVPVHSMAKEFAETLGLPYRETVIIEFK